MTGGGEVTPQELFLLPSLETHPRGLELIILRVYCQASRWSWRSCCIFGGTCPQLLTYLLTYSMVQSPSWEANWFAASQEIPCISQNRKVHYRTHKGLPLVSILGKHNPVHIPTSHLLEIHPNIIHTSMPRSPQWSSSLRFPHQDPIHPPLLTHTCHMPNPSHSSSQLSSVNYFNVYKLLSIWETVFKDTEPKAISL